MNLAAHRSAAAALLATALAGKATVTDEEPDAGDGHHVIVEWQRTLRPSALEWRHELAAVVIVDTPAEADQFHPTRDELVALVLVALDGWQPAGASVSRPTAEPSTRDVGGAERRTVIARFVVTEPSACT